MRIVDVRAATHVRKISGADMCAYHLRQWCSTAQIRSKPICSAKTACSTQSRMHCCSFCFVGNAICASKIIENFTCCPPLSLADVPLGAPCRTRDEASKHTL